MLNVICYGFGFGAFVYCERARGHSCIVLWNAETQKKNENKKVHGWVENRANAAIVLYTSLRFTSDHQRLLMVGILCKTMKNDLRWSVKVSASVHVRLIRHILSSLLVHSSFRFMYLIESRNMWIVSRCGEHSTRRERHFHGQPKRIRYDFLKKKLNNNNNVIQRDNLYIARNPSHYVFAPNWFWRII